MPVSLDGYITKMSKLLHDRLPGQANDLESFVRLYLAGISADYLEEATIEDVYALLLAHWNIAKQRLPGSDALIRVYNPVLERDGWESAHTVIDIITDDTPFLVDSVRMAINQDGSSIHLSIHPVMHVQRGEEGHFKTAGAPRSAKKHLVDESFMHFQIDRQNDEESLTQIHKRIEQALLDVKTAVADFAAMRVRLSEVLSQAKSQALPLENDELNENFAYLQWLLEGNFVFLGYRQHSLVNLDGEDQLNIIPGTSLGILRKEESDDGEQLCRSFASLPADIRRLARVPELLVLTRSGSASRVHRPGYMDYIGIKTFNTEGEVTGVHRFLGLYTSSAYTSDTHHIPLLRRKVENVLRRSGLHQNSYAERNLLSVLENYPRNELFQISEDELLEASIGIMQLQERQETRIFIRKDPYRRFYNCLVFIPRDHFNTEVRQSIGRILEQALGGETVNFSVQINEALLARVNFLIHISSDAIKLFDIKNIESDIVAVSQPWRDMMRNALIGTHGEEQGIQLFRLYGEGFRADYRESYSPEEAVQDIKHIAALQKPGDISMELLRKEDSPDNLLRFKLFSFGVAVALSEALPMLENMGLKVIDEHSSRIRLKSGETVWIHDFGLQHTEQELQLEQVKSFFEDAFKRIFQGESSNDGFNRLILRAIIDWRRVDILRAYSHYLRQVRGTFSHDYMIQAMVGNAHIAAILIQQFETRFDPDFTGSREERNAQLEAQIIQLLEQVESLDEDRIIRRFMGAISASLRTNYFQLNREGGQHDYLSIKFDSARVPDMPEPRPKYEIFVYSPRVEGVHLRGDKIARGGLRWSDRQEDFRTEVLGLVKAQMVKNSVIVPGGSKGGFLTKQLPVQGTRDQILAEGINCYRTFISGLLDITDNLVDGVPVPPERVFRHDGDDPYLVVAADKGTATFSDIANEVAASYQFWLGDAFASGGSVGYDHKGMGITARGAWESVKRHFKDLSMDIDNNPFTVVGIGDMSGDVFGNGLLLSRNIELIGAFNHQHIFLDPNPDCEQSYAERERLFNLPRSGWEDYNRSIISQGGGIFARSSKSIQLSEEMAHRLQISVTRLTPVELIQLLLKARVDLLWNGGIGTYVKASHEQHADVGDRSNEALRINGNQLRCRVVAEGGNLGLTQSGRIEFAQQKGCIFTDAIDNSAGVDCSDHEVNIKILLNTVMSSGEMTLQQRSELLASMTDEVALLVLKNNFYQTQALSLSSFNSRRMLEAHGRLIRKLEHQGGLNRALEYLPTDEVMQERLSASEGLTAPELSVLIAYVKIGLSKGLIASDLPDDPYLEQTLIDYFPTALRSAYPDAMMGHRLRREIIATELANGLVNRAGITFMYRMQEETGATEGDITRSFIIVREIFGLNNVWKQIESLDISDRDVQKNMMFETRKLLERSVRWMIQNAPRPIHIKLNVERYQARIQYVAALLQSDFIHHQAQVNQKYRHLLESGVPEQLAAHSMIFDTLSASMELVEISIQTHIELDSVVTTFFGLGDLLQLPWLREKIGELPRNTRWQAIARVSLRDDLLYLQKSICIDVLNSPLQDESSNQMESWRAAHGFQIEHCVQLIAELNAVPAADFTTLSVVLRELFGFVRKDLVEVSAAPLADYRQTESIVPAQL